VESLLQTEWASRPDGCRRLLELAGSHGVQWLDSLDVFLYLIEDENRLPYASLAVLRDRRTAAVLARRFQKLRQSESERAVAERLMIARTLFHLDWNVETVDSLLVEETDPVVRRELVRAVVNGPHRDAERESRPPEPARLLPVRRRDR
jgi:hypothetical protein